MVRKWQVAIASGFMLSALVVPVAEATSYTVQKGDTLSKIARETGTTVQQLKQWNELEQDIIYINQKLRIAKKEVGAQKEPIIEKLPFYIVKKGDTLAAIAKKNNMTVAKLKELNKLQTDVITINQQLLITSDGISNSTEKVIVSTKPKVEGQAIYDQVVQLAHELVGTPYVFGGNTVAGFDCSGLVKYIYSSVGVEISRKSSLDYFLQDTIHVEQPVAGDVVFFQNTYTPTISHMGIYIGNDQFIHAGTAGVEIASMTTSYWTERFVAFKRFSAVHEER